MIDMKNRNPTQCKHCGSLDTMQVGAGHFKSQSGDDSKVIYIECKYCKKITRVEL